jgi:hypothetical protein
VLPGVTVSVCVAEAVQPATAAVAATLPAAAPLNQKLAVLDPAAKAAVLAGVPHDPSE